MRTSTRQGICFRWAGRTDLSRRDALKPTGGTPSQFQIELELIHSHLKCLQLLALEALEKIHQAVNSTVSDRIPQVLGRLHAPTVPAVGFSVVVLALAFA
jgi:hypothetical protein